MKPKEKELVPFEECSLGLGLAIIGKAVQTLEGAPYIIMGMYDTLIKYTFYQQDYDKKPEKESDLDDPRLDQLLENMKTFFRDKAQSLFDEVERQERLMEIGENIQKRKAERWKRKQEEKKVQATAQSIKDTYKPSKQGTVAEIAKELGISKSEVRRRKRDGEL